MRRLLLVSLAVSLAAVLASSVSLFVFTGDSQAGSSSEGSPSQGSLVEGPALPEEEFPPYSQIVDNASPGHFKAPGGRPRPRIRPATARTTASRSLPRRRSRRSSR